VSSSIKVSATLRNRRREQLYIEDLKRKAKLRLKRYGANEHELKDMRCATQDEH